MPKIRYDHYKKAADLVRKDLCDLQVSERVAARLIGLSRSTFNAFLNLQHTKPRDGTIEKIVRAAFLGEETKQQLQVLREYESMLFAGKIRPFE
ncbi:MAG: hypothetical protein AAF557_02515 [Pseudomonadota bacterium]